MAVPVTLVQGEEELRDSLLATRQAEVKQLVCIHNDDEHLSAAVTEMALVIQSSGHRPERTLASTVWDFLQLERAKAGSCCRGGDITVAGYYAALLGRFNATRWTSREANLDGNLGLQPFTPALLRTKTTKTTPYNKYGEVGAEAISYD